MSPKEGDVLLGPPFVLQMCFAQPINIRDLDKGGDFKFSLVKPDRFGLGLWNVFQTDGNGVAVYPGPAEGQINGEWTFQWRVTDPGTLEPAEGTTKFTVDPGGQPVPTSTPPACLAGGSPGPTRAPAITASSSAAAVPSPSGGPAATSPSPTSGPTRSAGPTSNPVVGAVGDDSGPDILLLSLLMVGAVGGAALLALIGYLVRRRIGYSPHRPPPGGGSGGPEHH